jgi:glycosyltransferase involved in cell wall biosynthesis
MTAFLSLCMIVKNEEKVLKRCLDSVQGIVDEIVIVDTGSDDRTKAIAAQYTDKIYDFAWTDSFSDARNFAQSKATGEWILVLDADEYVDQDNLKEAKEQLAEQPESVDALSCKIYNFTGIYGEQIVQHHSLRIYRNKPSIRFIRKVHEQLDKTDGDLVTQPSNLVLYHSGYLLQTVKEKDKNKRNTTLIKQQLKRSGHAAFDFFNMGNEYLSKGEIEKALEAYTKAYQNKRDFRYSWVPFCVVQIVHCLIRLERFNDALRVINDAQSIWTQSPDFKFMKGQVFVLQHRLEDAKDELLDLVNHKEKYQSPIKSIDYLEFFPYQFLGKIYEMEEDYNKAVFYYVQALNANPKHYDIIYSLLQILVKFNQTVDVRKFIDKQNWTDSSRDLFMLIRILLDLGNNELSRNYINQVEQDEVIKEGFLVKLNLIEGNLEEAVQRIKASGLAAFYHMFQYGCFDLYDLLILGLALKETSVLERVDKLPLSPKEKSLIKFVVNESTLTKADVEDYIKFAERCIKMKQFNLFEELLKKRTHYPKKRVNLELGHLLYKYGFVDLAVSFYQEVGEKDYDVQTFVNIIDAFLKNGYSTDALNFAILALKNNKCDYRIFKAAINILKDQKTEKESLIKLGLKYFPDSKYLLSQVNSSVS